MNRILLLLALSASLFITACGDDVPNPRANDNLLNYDGENATGPLLDAGEYQTAARFTPAQTANFVGRNLIGVRWYTGPIPASCEVRIYDQGTSSTPGALLYSANVINQVNDFGWTEHTLSSPIPIEAEDLWISIAFTHDRRTQSIGCDAGPSRANGDWIFDAALGEWQTYRARTNESINWNIRGIVAE